MGLNHLTQNILSYFLIYSEPSRRRVSYGQVEQLWEFLIRHRNIAMGFNKNAQARNFSRQMWEEIAHNLNSHGDGAVKDWKAWCKVRTLHLSI